MEQKKNRIQSIDALRGLCVILMVIHHFFYDLVAFCGAPGWLFSNPLFDLLHYIFAGIFIFLAGLSSRFSRSNVKRGLKCLAVALIMTAVTSLPFLNMPILFGVLHLLGTCMVFYGLTARLWDKLRRSLMPVLCIALLVGSALLVEYVPIPDAAARVLFPFGWMYSGFYSSDYFPLFPWLFVFLLGTWAGWYVKEGKLPQKLYTLSVPVLPAVGRKAFVVYVFHQPVLYAVTMAIDMVLK